jgi:hypothetical protein
MASLVLTVVGSVVAGPFGGLAGGLVGSYLDQAFIFPALFGRPSGPRLEDLQVQTAAEGSYGRYVLGPSNRLAGTLIWSSDFLEREESDKKGPTIYKYSVHVAVAVCEGPIRKIKRVWADSKVIYDDGTLDSRVGDLRIYTGTSTQAIDPLIDASDPGNTPAYRGTCYIVIENLDVTDWGNRVPNFSFEVVADIQMPVQEAIKRIADRAGIAAGEIDTDRVCSCLRGYVVLGPQETTRILDPLMTAFSLGARDDNGVLTFWRRGQEDSYGVVPDSDLGAAEDGRSSASHVVQLTDTREFQLPSQVAVQHLDPDWDLQQGSQRERRVNATNTDVVSITLPITMTVDEARNVAKTILWSSYSERRLVEFDLPPSYIRVQEGDLLTISISGVQETIRTLEVSRGYNGIIRIKGHVTDTGTYDQESLVDRRESTAASSVTPLNWELLNIPAITSNHLQVLGFYVAAAFSNVNTAWSGSQGFKSADGSAYTSAWSHQREAYIGKADTVLDNINASSLWWDNVNTVDVTMLEGTLSSMTEDEVLYGKNRMLVGNEIIGFKTATLLAPRKYRLSGLLRGLRNTEDEMTTHEIEERVVVLNMDQLVFYTAIEQNDIGVDRFYKNVASGGNVATAPVKTLTSTAATFRHFTPCHIDSFKAFGSDDITVYWTRRSRALTAPFSIGEAPLLDSDEIYVVEIRVARGIVRRSVTVAGIRSFTYTEAMQTADSLTPGVSGFFIYVHQVSSVAGMSKPAMAFYSPT